MPKADPKSLGDEALIQACAPALIEEWLLRTGCLGSPAALALLLVTLLAYGDLAHPLFLGPALTVAALFWAHHLVLQPKRRYRADLDYRRGLAGVRNM